MKNRKENPKEKCSEPDDYFSLRLVRNGFSSQGHRNFSSLIQLFCFSFYSHKEKTKCWIKDDKEIPGLALP